MLKNAFEFVDNSFLMRAFKVILYCILRIVKNFVPPAYQINYRIHSWQKSLRLALYKYCTAEDYFLKYTKEPVNSYVLPSGGKVYVIDNLFCYICKYSSVTYTKDKRIILETIRRGIIDEEVKLNTSGAVYIDEAINLALCWNDNFWHFQYCVLDKIYAMESIGFKGKYLVFDKEYIQCFMKLMGISDDRVVYVNKKETYHVGKLHIISDFVSVSAEMLINARNTILSNLPAAENNKYPKRIYIMRSGNYSRKIINDEEIINLLKKYGFETFYPDDYTVEEQIRYFNSAEVIVSPHGGCCANALYMKPNSHFIECFSYTWLNPCILDIVRPNDIYYHMVVEPEPKNSSYKIKTKSRDYTIDPNMLEIAIYKYCEKEVA